MLHTKFECKECGALTCYCRVMENAMYVPALWLSYSTEDRVDFLVECGCNRPIAEDYSYRDFASLPYRIREKIEALENFD